MVNQEDFVGSGYVPRRYSRTDFRGNPVGPLQRKYMQWAEDTVDPWLLKNIPMSFWEWDARNPEVPDKIGSGFRALGGVIRDRNMPVLEALTPDADMWQAIKTFIENKGRRQNTEKKRKKLRKK